MALTVRVVSGVFAIVGKHMRWVVLNGLEVVAEILFVTAYYALPGIRTFIEPRLSPIGQRRVLAFCQNATTALGNKSRVFSDTS